MALKKILLACALSLLTLTCRADAQSANWDARARAADAAYWQAYNEKDPKAMNALLSKDVEFYHDRGGAILGKSALAAVNNGMRSNPNRLRRELVAGSLHFSPMRKGEALYGALVTGEHEFYLTEAGKPEVRVGRASFTHLMLLQGGEWKIARIFSYEHADAQPAAGG